MHKFLKCFLAPCFLSLILSFGLLNISTVKEANADSYDRMLARFKSCTSEKCSSDTGRYLLQLSSAKKKCSKGNKGNVKGGKGKTNKRVASAKKGSKGGKGKKPSKCSNKGSSKGGKTTASCKSTPGQAIPFVCPASIDSANGKVMALEGPATTVVKEGYGVTQQYCGYKFYTPFQDDLVIGRIEITYTTKPRNEKQPQGISRHLCTPSNSAVSGDSLLYNVLYGYTYIYPADRQFSVDVTGNIEPDTRQRIAEEIVQQYSKLGATCVPAKCK